MPVIDLQSSLQNNNDSVSQYVHSGSTVNTSVSSNQQPVQSSQASQNPSQESAIQYNLTTQDFINWINNQQAYQDLANNLNLAQKLSQVRKLEYVKHHSLVKQLQAAELLNNNGSVRSSIGHGITKDWCLAQVARQRHSNQRDSDNVLHLPKVRPTITSHIKYGDQHITHPGSMLSNYLKRLAHQVKRKLNWPVAKLNRINYHLGLNDLSDIKPLALAREDKRDELESLLNKLYKAKQKRTQDEGNDTQQDQSPNTVGGFSAIDQTFHELHNNYWQAKEQYLAQCMKSWNLSLIDQFKKTINERLRATLNNNEELAQLDWFEAAGQINYNWDVAEEWANNHGQQKNLFQQLNHLAPLAKEINKLKKLAQEDKINSQRQLNRNHSRCRKRIKEINKQLRWLKDKESSSDESIWGENKTIISDNFDYLQRLTNHIQHVYQQGFLDLKEKRLPQTVINNDHLEKTTHAIAIASTITLLTLTALYVLSIPIPHFWPVTLALTGVYFLCTMNSALSLGHKLWHGRIPQVNEMVSTGWWLINVGLTATTQIMHPIAELSDKMPRVISKIGRVMHHIHYHQALKSHPIEWAVEVFHSLKHAVQKAKKFTQNVIHNNFNKQIDKEHSSAQKTIQSHLLMSHNDLFTTPPTQTNQPIPDHNPNDSNELFNGGQHILNMDNAL